MTNYREYLEKHGVDYKILERCDTYHFDRIEGWARSAIYLSNSGYVLENIYVIQNYEGGRDLISVYRHEQDRHKILICYTLPN